MVSIVAYFDKAVSELKQANLQNPYNLYRLALAYNSKGNKEKAKKLFLKAAKFNITNSLNLAYVRNKAKQMLFEM